MRTSSHAPRFSRSGLCLFTLLVLPASAAFGVAASGGSSSGAKDVGEPGSAASCGDGLLAASESCTECPADCQIRTCETTDRTLRFTVRFHAEAEQAVSSGTFRVAYRTDRLRLPGTAAEETVRRRIDRTPEGALLVVNDLDYALRVVMSRAEGLPRGSVFDVRFDVCRGPEPSVQDLLCVIEGCAGRFGPVTNCSCAVLPGEATPTD